jgi:hypothetical protein
MQELSACLEKFQDLQVEYAKEDPQLDWFSPDHKQLPCHSEKQLMDIILGMVSPVTSVTASAEMLSLQDKGGDMSLATAP